MLTVPATIIPIPSDFHITVSSVTDSEGNAIDVTQTYIAFRFFIGDVSHYCISDPLNNNFKNAVKATGMAGRWYLYCHTVTDDTDTWRKLEHFIEIH